MPVSAEPLSGIYWTELRIFLEVANARSFNKAAQQLNVSHPKIGRAVRLLEEALGTELLATSGPRGVTLTPRGAQLARDLVKVDRALAKALQGLGRAG
jgi:DNA-binding transcriptional LysR family regulator